MKEPWEMTRAEFVGPESPQEKKFKRAAERLFAAARAKGFVEGDGETPRLNRPETKKALKGTGLTELDFKTGLNGYATLRDATGDYAGQLLLSRADSPRSSGHAAEVYKAVKEGKKVPPEVLADYPELAKQSQTQKGASNVQEEAAQAEVLNNAPPPSPEAAGGEVWVAGDRAEYTGKKVTKNGGEFAEVRMLEGTRKGKLQLVPTKDQEAKNTAKKKQEWQDQQEQFRRLNKKSPAPPPPSAEVAGRGETGLKPPPQGYDRGEWNDRRAKTREKGKRASTKDLEIFAGEKWADDILAARKAKKPPPTNTITQKRADLEMRLRELIFEEYGNDIADISSQSPLALQVERGEKSHGHKVSLETAISEAEKLPESHPARMVLHNLRELEKNPRGTKFVTVNTNDVADGTGVVVNDSETLIINKEDGIVEDGIESNIPEGGIELTGKKILPPEDKSAGVEVNLDEIFNDVKPAEEARPAPTSDTGIFGQEIFRPATGKQQGGLFHEPVNVERPTEPTIGSKSATDPNNTAPMFPPAKPPKGFRGGYVRFGRTGAEDIDPYDDPEIERRDRENKGMKRPTILARVMDTAGKWYREATRSHEHLDVSKKPDAEMDNILRIREAKIAGAAGKAYRLMRDFVGDLNPKQYDRFRRLLILDDLAKDVEQGKYEDRFDSVPFFGKPGDTKQTILDRIKSQKERYEARLDDATRKAVKARNAEVRKLTEYMVELNILPESVLSDDRYYHRQVTEYLNMREYATTGGKGPDAKMYKRGFQKQRTGGGDFNSAYEQSEHEYLTHALRQIATAESHNEIRQFNIGGGLRAAAKEKNLIAAFGGIENYREFRALKDEKAEIIQQIKSGEADKSELRDWNNEHGDRLDELWMTRGEDTHIAKAIEEMYKTSGATTDLESDTGDVWGVEDGELADLPPAQLAQRILNDGTKTFSPEAVASANWFFKALSDKRQKIRQLAGKQFVEWKDLIPEDYTLWSPKAGTQFARILSIPESIVQQIVESNREFDESMLREMFARVPGEQLVIPKNFADQLDTPTTNTNETAAGAAARYINGKWKQYILLNPAKAAKYNLNNFSGDLDAVIAADPGILKFSKQAAADLISFMQGKATPAVRAEIERAMELGVTNSGEALNEIPDVSGTATFKKLTGGNPNPVKWYWDTVGNASTLRENVFRLAAYRRAMEKIKAGNKFYWASNRNRVNAVGDPQQKAAMLARDLLGDYGNISVFGQWMRQKAVPFWSWMEINLPRYVRLFRNSVHDGTGGRFAGAMALKTAKAPVTLAARAALSPVKTTLLASALYGAIAAWNAMMFPGEDDGIEDGRLRLLLGKNSDGKMMSIRFQGAFSDALAWFGLEDAAGKIARVQRGEASMKDEVIKSAKAPVNKLVNSMLPIPKTIGEAAVGKTTFPDVFNPRNIRDSAEHLAGLVDLDTPYRWLKSIPQRGSAFDLIGNTADPEEQAYQRIKSVAAKYKEKLGKGSDPGDPTPRSDALYYYRKSRVMGDDVKARYWLNEYKRLGGTPDGLRRSIESANPRRFIAQGDVRGFWDSLSPQQRQDFRRAEKFYKRVYQPR